jgi:hypothetical protein
MYDMENTESIAFLCAVSLDERVLILLTNMLRIRERTESWRTSISMERSASAGDGACVDHGEFSAAIGKLSNKIIADCPAGIELC